MTSVDTDNGNVGVRRERVDQTVGCSRRPARHGIPILFNKNRSPCHGPDDSCARTSTGEGLLVLQELVEVGNGVFEAFA